MTTEELQTKSEPSSNPSGALLRTLLVCDLIDSTSLVERLGDRAAAELLRKHDRMARAAMEHHGGREIDKTDGFLVLFDRPIEAVAFALEYQHELRALAKESKHSLSARVGIHVGDIITWDNAPADVARGAKAMEVEGLAKPVAARLMALAGPGQILMTGVAKALAERGARELGTKAETIRWILHGQYHFKGLPDPIAVFEVGEAGGVPMRAPPNSPKAWRALPLWRRPFPLTVASLAVVIAAGVLVYVSIHSERVLAFNERDWVVLGDLVNVNADKTLDVALGTAFRIGIEESRFVNVLPDVQVRQSLARMQRDGAARIDRETGSEIALREQARAVIIPSVAQYGHKLRMSVELIDPHGARTVSTRTEDANDPKDVLPALDSLVRGIRSSLGESLIQIQSTSQPLEKVTTANLEALRAYSRAQQVLREGDIDQAISLLGYATELDPSFATAHARMGSLLYAQQRYPDARAALDKALSINGRLTERERLYIRAHLARFADPKTTLDLWRMYSELYPDQGVGQNNLGNFRYTLFHDYAGAEAALIQAAATRHPWRNLTLHALGYALLAQEKVDEAEQQFRASQALSPATMLFSLCDALATRGKLDEAARYLDDASRQAPVYEVERGMRRATLLIVRGQIDASAAVIAAVLSETAQLPTPNPRWRAQAAAIALRVAQGDVAAARDLAARHLAELSSTVAQPSSASLETMENLLYTTGWAARLGLENNAREALTLADKQGALEQFPVRARLAALAQAELDLRGGQAEAVAARLRRATDGSELWELHELRARALRALGDV
ncbi:MAG: putative peptide modification system cyclase, partial [Betaproteobacteria bacterium]